MLRTYNSPNKESLSEEIHTAILQLIEDDVFSLLVNQDWSHVCQTQLRTLIKREDRDKARRWKAKRLKEKQDHPREYCARCIRAGVSVKSQELQDIYKEVLLEQQAANMMKQATRKAAKKAVTLPSKATAMAEFSTYRDNGQEEENAEEDAASTVELYTDGALALTDGGISLANNATSTTTARAVPFTYINGKQGVADYQLPLLVDTPELNILLNVLHITGVKCSQGIQKKVVGGLHITPDGPVDPRDSGLYEMMYVNKGRSLLYKKPILVHAKKEKPTQFFSGYKKERGGDGNDVLVQYVKCDRALEEQEKMNARLKGSQKQFHLILFQLPDGVVLNNIHFEGMPNGKIARGSTVVKQKWEKGQSLVLYEFYWRVGIKGEAENLNHVEASNDSVVDELAESLAALTNESVVVEYAKVKKATALESVVGAKVKEAAVSESVVGPNNQLALQPANNQPADKQSEVEYMVEESLQLASLQPESLAEAVDAPAINFGITTSRTNSKTTSSRLIKSDVVRTDASRPKYKNASDILALDKESRKLDMSNSRSQKRKEKRDARRRLRQSKLAGTPIVADDSDDPLSKGFLLAGTAWTQSEDEDTVDFA